MRKKIYLLFITLVFLQGCKSATQRLAKPFPPFPIQSVYPFDTQKDVSPSSSVFISFVVPIQKDSLFENFILTSGNESVAGTLEFYPDEQFARFKPSMPLEALKEYSIIIGKLKKSDGTDLILPEDGVIAKFTTGGGSAKTNSSLRVVFMDPSPEQVFDFSTFRFVLSEPVDPKSVVYGSTFKFIKKSDLTPVDGKLLISGTRIIFDPDEDLLPDEEYQVELTNGITSIDGSSLEPQTISIVPKWTGNKTTLNLKVAPEIETAGGNLKNLPVSDVIGIPLNSIEIDSKLLGRQYTVMKGVLKSEMADLSLYSDYIPVVIRKGQRIVASNLKIKLGGEIDTLLDTGEISFTMVTDSTGYISGNPYKQYNNTLPPAVYFTIDVCLTAVNPQVNAILNQDTLNVQLYGYLTRKGDDLVISTGGTTAINVLNAEYASVTLALSLETTTAQIEADAVPPVVTSVTPLDNEDGVPVESSIILTFSEPINEKTLSSKIKVFKDDLTEINGNLIVQGSSVIFKPVNALEYGTSYTVSVGTGIVDLNGNSSTTEFSSRFTTLLNNSSTPRPLLVSSIYPGVPCILKAPNPSSPGDAGECASDDDDPKKFSKFQIPLNREIVIYFTRPVDPQTISEDSFKIIDANSLSTVSGQRIVNGNRVAFIPDSPWLIGNEYKIILHGGADAVCDTGEICDYEGYPLNTDILDDGSETAGGEDLVIPFVGGDFSADPFLTLTLLPYTDTNSNGIYDTSPPSEVGYAENSVTIRNASDDTILATTYLSGTLISVIKGYEPTSGGVLLETFPGNWMFGTSALIIILNTDRIIMRPTGSSIGYILNAPPGDPDHRPIIKMDMEVWMNAVNDIADSVLEHNPKEMNLEGRLDFLPDGRMFVELTNTNIVDINVMGGALVLRINPGDARVRAQGGFRY